MKTGVFCGTFDPIHTGHAMVANYAAQWAGLDRVLLMVSPLNPFKEGTKPASDADRLNMASLVAEMCGNVEISDLELHLPKPTYTYRTLRLLREMYPDDELYLLIGSDNWPEFHRWKDYEKILKEFHLLIYPRPGYKLEGEMPANVSLLEEAPQALISSTFIRQSIKEGKNLNFFLPQVVYNYIRNHNLYSGSD